MKRSLLILLIGLLALTALGMESDVFAEGEDSSSPDEIELRLQFIRQSMERDARQSRNWRAAWFGINSGFAVGSFVAAPFVNKEDRVDYYIGGGSAVFGAAVILFDRPNVIRDWKKLEQELAAGSSGQNREEVLHWAENLMIADAKNQELYHSWMAHGGNVLFNTAISLVMGLGYKHWESAGINLGVGIAMGELLIYTQPHHLKDDLETYNNGGWRQPVKEHAWNWQFAPQISGQEKGLQVGFTF